MNRKQKIIVSVTGIFLVLLILVGLTYAYFLTQIVGNTNEKSISVTTADLRLTYGDGTTQILTSDTKLVPSANPIGTKDFTVTNNGDATSYAVIIENVIVKDATTEELTTFNCNDFVYTLSCTSNNGTCNGVSEQTVLPMSDNILVENDIEKDEVHTYEIVVYYLETNQDQSSDMNKTLSARINIEDANRINPYSSNTNSLAYNIINNALNVTNDEINDGYAAYRTTPLTKPLEQTTSIYAMGDYRQKWNVDMSSKQSYYVVVGDNIYPVQGETSPGFKLKNPQILLYSSNYNNLNGKYYLGVYATENLAKEAIQDELILFPSIIASTSMTNITLSEYLLNIDEIENSLSKTSDSYTATTGYDSYYFRGGVENNYVEFSGMCFRIVRIQGDGSVRLALSKEALCSTINNETDTKTGFIGKGIYGYSKTNQGEEEWEFYAMSDYINSTTGMRSILNSWFNEEGNFSELAKTKIKNDNWCIGNMRDAFDNSGTVIGTPQERRDNFSFYYYSGHNRYNTKNPSLVCDNTGLSTEIDKNQVGTFTMDEIAYAGISTKAWAHAGAQTYLFTNAEPDYMSGMLTLTPLNFDMGTFGDNILLFSGMGTISYEYYNFEGMIRPIITLIPNIELAANSGNGTQTNPYRVIES